MTKKVPKTKKILIDVSRDLFAKHGKRNTTMHEIAEASKKGRRTLYTYFTNKEEIFRAVVEKELEYLLEELDKVFISELSADEKLKNFALTHLDTVKHIVNRNGSLRADFFTDIYQVERSRKKINTKEIAMIRVMLQEGVEQKIFKRMDIDLSAVVIFHIIKGLEVPYIRKNLTKSFEKNKDTIVDFIFKGIVN